MKISLIRDYGKLIPAGEYATSNFYRLELDKEYVFNVTLKRNHKFHRLAFALLNTIFDNQDFFEDFEIFRKWITMKAGYIQTVATPQGTMFLPESLAYENMEQDEFEKWYQAVITFAVKEYGHDRDVLERIMNFA